MQYLHIRTFEKINDSDLLLTVENLENGYYVPETFPEITAADLQKLAQLKPAERISSLLALFFPSFTRKELDEIVGKQFSKIDSLLPLKPFNHYMPLYLAELDKLDSGSIYDYILPLLVQLQAAALRKRQDRRDLILLEHNLGNSSFVALVRALESVKYDRKLTLYYNPKRINPVVHAAMKKYVNNIILAPVDNALSLPTINLFASRLRHIKSQVALSRSEVNDSKSDSDNYEKTPQSVDMTNEENLSDYPAPTLSTLDSLSAVLIATALQLAVIAELPLNKADKIHPENKEEISDSPEKGAGDSYRRVNLFLPAKQGYLLLAACYAKVMCPLINKIILSGQKGNMLSELVHNFRFEVKGKHNTFELPVQLERMLFEFSSRDNVKSLAWMNDFAHKGVLQLSLQCRHNINGVISAELYTEKAEEKLLLTIYDRFDLLLPPLSVLAFAGFLKYYEKNQKEDELDVVFVNASIYRYADRVINAIYAPAEIKGRKFKELMQALALESGQLFPQWFIMEQDIPPENIVNNDRYDPEKHRAEFEKIRLEGLTQEEIDNLV